MLLSNTLRLYDYFYTINYNYNESKQNASTGDEFNNGLTGIKENIGVRIEVTQGSQKRE